MGQGLREAFPHKVRGPKRIMRILIATITAGGGHLQAAAALDEAWRAMRPRDVVEKVDLQKFFAAA